MSLSTNSITNITLRDGSTDHQGANETSGTPSRSRPLRVAFLTPEFVTNSPSKGGLASYLSRMTIGLEQQGHHVEIFTRGPQEVTNHHGVRVESVGGTRNRKLRQMKRLLNLIPGVNVTKSFRYLEEAWAIYQAFQRRHSATPFDVVQSSNTGLAGYFLPTDAGVRHIIRCSSSRYLWHSADERRVPLDVRLMDYLERRTMKRCDYVYAPSQFLADYFRENHGIQMDTIRPPLGESNSETRAPSTPLPGRYLIHFGVQRPRKGTDLVLRAAQIVSREVPDFRIVLAGDEAIPGYVQKIAAEIGLSPEVFIQTGPLTRPELHHAVKNAIASVLPSRVDNLPNTVIESLRLNVPVIGTDGASINELVSQGKNGQLVPVNDFQCLAKAMHLAWQGNVLGAEATPSTEGLLRFACQGIDPIESFLQAARGTHIANANVAAEQLPSAKAA